MIECFCPDCEWEGKWDEADQEDDLFICPECGNKLEGVEDFADDDDDDFYADDDDDFYADDEYEYDDEDADYEDEEE